MAIRHLKKVYLLRLPSSVRFVLSALARYANAEDICWPGITKLSDMTGYCEKTVVRSLRVLSRLGIIDVHKNPKGNNHIYTLYITGDIKAWDEYLKSKAHVLRDMNRENQSSSVSSKSIYSNSSNSEIKEGNIEKIKACDSSHVATYNLLNPKSILGEDINDIPPGKRKLQLQAIWEESVPKYYKGLKIIITADDKWIIDEMYTKYENELPILDFIEYIIINWQKFRSRIKENYGDYYIKNISLTPKLSSLKEFYGDAINLYWQSKA
jgi:predicted transcriptional regulator